ncbi:hypothetical protein [Mucilaginibacter myungsuensis]|uniref:Uncharacterized protein n=1 Tax=Mucilaginibacter myungsuensis TaxID=649104 RepID=A0A929KYU1_9SPHI|nr:hypothetical protein [Mucilaginibacter myungsuensis]MBE9664196.1 hypothetical protein [Mucilaginibacter myungsuensis]MDN3599898.1 hypothetical protein [Mucilaginibacter myungsuensis]
MKQPIFVFQKLTIWQICVALAYLSLSVFVYFKWIKYSDSDQSELIIFYAVGTQVFLIFLYYLPLRNLTVYLIWLSFAAIQFAGYYILKGSIFLRLSEIESIRLIRNTAPLLLLFQVFRVISLNIQHQEFVIPGKGGTDLWDERSANFLDFCFMLLYLAAFWGLIFWQ